MGVSKLLGGAVHGGSRPVWSVVLTAAAFAVSAGVTGCIFHDHEHDEWDDDETNVVNPPPPDNSNPLLVPIDADQVLESAPGEGVGMFVEYGTGGLWRIWTACDTNFTGAACGFEACVAVVDGSADVRGIRGEANESDDRIESFDDGFTCLTATTDTDTDGMLFETDPGAMVRLEMYLDGAPQPRFVYWVGDGILHNGAPSDPVDFAPVTP